MVRHGSSRVRWIPLLVSLALLVLVAAACGGSGSPSTTASPAGAAPTTVPTSTDADVPGTITATVSSVKNQDGSIFSVGVYDFDWSPGAANTFVGLIQVPITSDDFSSIVVVTGVGADGSPTKESASFQPGTYSVVFFISPPNSPPTFFTEVRVSVAGDITVSAPAWGSW